MFTGVLKSLLPTTSRSRANTASLDLSGVEFVTCCEVIVMYSPQPEFLYPQLAFDTEAAGTVALAPYLGGHNYDVVVTIPIDGQATFGFDVDIFGTVVTVNTLATLSGDLVLTGTTAVPIAPIVGAVVALGLLLSGAHAARARR